MSLSTWRATFELLRRPGALALMRAVQCQIRLDFLFAASGCGLFAALRSPRTRSELLNLLHARRPELLDALLDVGLSAGELSRRGETHSVVGRRSRALRADDGDALVALVEAYSTYYNKLYRELPQRLRGGPLSDELDRIGDLVARVSTISDSFLRTFVRRTAGSSPRHMLEIGCGSGAHLRSAAEAN